MDHEIENTLNNDDTNERLAYGVDAAIGWGGFSMTAAYNMLTYEFGGGFQLDGTSYLVQLGYLFPDTAWEIAARYSAYSVEPDGGSDSGATEIGVAVNYYIDGHADKVTLGRRVHLARGRRATSSRDTTRATRDRTTATACWSASSGSSRSSRATRPHPSLTVSGPGVFGRRAPFVSCVDGAGRPSGDPAAADRAASPAFSAPGVRTDPTP